MRSSGNVVHALLMGAGVLVVVLGSGCTLDSRYSRQIVFDHLDVTIPLEEEKLVRCDGAVADMDVHQRELFEEIGAENAVVTMTSRGRFGRQFAVPLENGMVCSFLWVLDDPDPLTVAGRLNHEKFHALHALQPTSIVTMNEALRDKGYAIDLGAIDEELAAAVVEVVTLYATGSQVVWGTPPIPAAVDLLERSRIPTPDDQAHGSPASTDVPATEPREQR